jgi:hypothetical protein
MKTVCASAFLAFLAVSFVAAKSRHSMFRVHVEANPNDTAAFAVSVPARFLGQEISIERVPRITEHDVVAFYPYSAPDGTYGALFQLDGHGTLVLDTLSIERRGELLFVFIDGRSITELQIDRRVSDGRIYIASGLTKADIKLMKKDWPLIGRRRKR